MRRQVAVLAAALALLASGCGSGAPGDLTVSAERQLVAKVQDVRDAAATGTYAELARQVRALNALAKRLHSQGQVTDARFAAIEDAAGKLLADAQPKPSASPSQSSSPPPSSPTPSATATSPSPSPTASQSQSQSPTPTTTISIP